MRVQPLSVESTYGWPMQRNFGAVYVNVALSAGADTMSRATSRRATTNFAVPAQRTATWCVRRWCEAMV
jgi:hypothetical protein